MAISTNKRESGKWEYRIRFTDRNGNRISKSHGGFKTKSEAIVAGSELERSLMYGANIAERDKIVFAEYFDSWLDRYKYGKHAAITEARYKSISKVLHKYFGTQLLIKVTKDSFQDFINEYAPTREKETVKKNIGYIRSMVSHAIDAQIIRTDFTKDVDLGNAKDSGTKTIKYLEIENLQKVKNKALEKATLASTTRYAILTGIYSGMRYSEVLGLTWNDIDFDNNQITINKSWDYTYTHDFKPTKNKPSNRVIDIPLELVNILKQLKAEQSKRWMKIGYRDDKNLVFRNAKRQIPGDPAANKMLRTIQTECGIPEESQITFHGLRHSHVSYLISQNVDIFYISKRLGHKNILITQKVYAHLLESTVTKEVEKTNQALAQL